MTIWIRFIKDDDQVELAFNTRMTNVHQASDLDQIVDEMVGHMETQIENPALLNSRFRFDEVLYLDVKFHQLNLMRSSSYLPLPDWLARKKAIINPQNNDEECFKCAVIAALRWTDIKSHPERISNFREFFNDYEWSGLKFPVSIKYIKNFEINNDIYIYWLMCYLLKTRTFMFAGKAIGWKDGERLILCLFLRMASGIILR